MKKTTLLLVLNLFFFSNIFSDPFEQLDIDFLKKKKIATVKKEKSISSPKSEFPSYESKIKDLLKITGVFDYYWDKDKNKLFLSIKPEQFGEIYLANMTRQSGDAYYYDSSSLMGEFPFIFKKVGNIIQFVHVNVLFRADKDRAIFKAIENDFSNSIIASSMQVSGANKSTGAILVDAKQLFLRDIGNVSQHGGGRYKFDPINSYYSSINSFPDNSELDIVIHYKSLKGTNAFTVPNSRSMEIKYHISLSVLKNNNFKPRKADDRLGYFSTIYQDYTNTLQETQYVRYINKWNLVKKDKSSVLSEPINPIVFWIENKVPEEFRQAIRDGVLGWNKSFEKIGFKNAIVVKQMPSDADWDPADIRYNTIRWFVQPGSGYAVGPSRANPFNGELYDADIRISADFVRGFYSEFDEFVNPVTDDEVAAIWKDPSIDDSINSHHNCNYADELRKQMSLGWHNLIAQGSIEGTSQDLMDYVYKGLVDLVLHEVGHTLGLRHNFKASSIYSVDQLSNPQFTAKYGISGSVMDYHAVSLLDNGNTMFQTFPGPYDDWAIEYGYSEFASGNEEENLENIANQSNHPILAYGTDEDTFGRSSRGIDPLCNLWDMSSDPIAFYDNQLDLVNKLWINLLDDFEKDGQRYQKIRSVFSQGIWEYVGAGRTASKFIGGIYFKRNHIGDPGDTDPFEVVSPEKQREALDFIVSHILDKDVFSFDPKVLNKLSPERLEDFEWKVWRMDRIDYPIHRVIKRIYTYTLYSLFDPRRLARVQDNEIKFPQGEAFTMEELFDKIDTSIWEELNLNENINSYKRELQNLQIEIYSKILFSSHEFNSDAQAMTRNSLKKILKETYVSLSNSEFDTATKAHLEFTAEKIETILNAEIQIN